MATTAAEREDLRRHGVMPAGLPLHEAAAYVGLSPNTFRAEVEAGNLPPPVQLKSRRKLWSLKALDRAISGDDAGPDSADAIDQAINRYAAR